MNSNRRRWKKLICVAIFISLMVLSGCSTLDAFQTEFLNGDSDEAETVKIGVFEPLSGDDEEAAKSEVEGIELAYSMYPTVDGKKVELVYADNRSDVEVAKTAIMDLIAEEPAVILGSYGDVNSLVASEYIEKAHIPAITITNTNPLITSTGDYYFRICFVDTYQGDALARYVYAKGKNTKAAVLVDSESEQSAAIAQKFVSRLGKLYDDENAVSLNLEYVSGTDDFSSQLKAIENSGVKYVLLPAQQEDAEKIISQAAEMNLDVQFLGTNDWDSDALSKDIGKKAASMTAYVKVSDEEVADTGSESMEDFLECYASMYGDAKEPDASVALGFDAYKVALQAISDVGSDAPGNRLRDALYRVEGYSGVSGTISFDASGNPQKSVTIYNIDPETGESYASCIVDADGTVKNIN